MKGFINNIISRHTSPVVDIRPRLPGKFEPVNFYPRISTEESYVPVVHNQSNNGLTENIETIKNDNRDESKNSIHEKSSLLTTNNVLPEIKSEIKSVDSTKDSIQELQGMDHINNSIRTEKIIPLTIEPKEKPRFSEKLPFESRIKILEINPVLINPHEDNLNLPVEKNELRSQTVTLLKSQIIDNTSEMNKPIQIKPDINNPSFKTPGLDKTIINFKNAYTESLPEQSMSTVIKVSIGRIEVRAVSPPLPLKINRTNVQKPKMSLDEYLNKRNSIK